MRVLVTGAAGFIGSHVCERLFADGHGVVGIDDLSTGSISNLDGIGVRLVEGSILDADALAEAMSGADAIVHLAARPSVPRSIIDPVASHEANATGTLRVLEAARTLDDPIVVVASSSSVYGANPTLPKREDLAVQPLSPYAVSKLATEQYTLAWQHSYGLRTLAFRFFNVFGPRQAPGHAYAAVIPAFTHAALTGVPLTIHGDGTQSRLHLRRHCDRGDRGRNHPRRHVCDAGEPCVREPDQPARNCRPPRCDHRVCSAAVRTQRGAGR